MRIGCMDVTRSGENLVTLRNAQAGHPEVTFTRYDWEWFLFAAASYALEFHKLDQAPSTLPLADALGDRLV